MATCGVGDAIAVVSHVATVSNPILVLPYSLLAGIIVYGILLRIVVAFTSVKVASSVDMVLLY